MKNYNLTMKGQILILQVTLLSLFTFFATNLQAKEVKFVKQEVNSYLESGEEIDMGEEILIKNASQNQRLIRLKIIAQGIRNNAKLELHVNGNELKLDGQLKDEMSSIHFTLPKAQKVHKLKLASNGAYVKLAKAKIYFDEPKDDDFSKTIPSL